jgi:hypothetical protein
MGRLYANEYLERSLLERLANGICQIEDCPSLKALVYKFPPLGSRIEPVAIEVKPVSRQSRRRAVRRREKLVASGNIASARIDPEKQRVVFTTKDMILNQLSRDGPKIRRSFDQVSRNDLAACSALFGAAQGLVTRHLHRLDDARYKATVSRLFSSASYTYLASIEVARHGYRRQYGILARTFVETIATIIALSHVPTALNEFHAGTLRSTKCIGWASKVLPPLGRYYGMLSEEFVHVGPAHAAFEQLSPYSPNDQALSFIIGSLRGGVWMLYLAAELAFHEEVQFPRYWKAAGGGVAYDPSDEERQWMSDFLGLTNF